MPNIEVEIQERVEVEIKIYCNQCGTGLCGEAEPHRTKQAFVVNPCPNCMDTKKDEGYNKGYNKGHDDAYKEMEESTK